RTDAWWLQPLLVLLALSVFVVYTTWAAFQGEHYFYHGGGAHYLSPFYSPLLFGEAHEPRWFGSTQPGWWPGFIPFSPALLILAGPAAMRFTCYYYRGAYYRSFWADPPACAVGEPRRTYLGENSFPLIMQNIHRYVFYPAAAFVMVLAWDGLRSFWFSPEGSGVHFGIGIGSVMITLNALFLGFYTFGCHCARHQIGGYLNELSKRPLRSKCYACVNALNKRHMFWAWVSLGWVMVTDLYVRLLSMGVIPTDPRFVF
ncbi:MAG: succinate dehydrogenase, partial [Planctomycetota bacterium]